MLVAADPYRAADHSSEISPGKVVLTIDAAGWPVIAAVIAHARRAARPGWSAHITATAGKERNPRTVARSDGRVRG